MDLFVSSSSNAQIKYNQQLQNKSDLFPLTETKHKMAQGNFQLQC